MANANFKYYISHQGTQRLDTGFIEAEDSTSAIKLLLNKEPSQAVYSALVVEQSQPASGFIYRRGRYLSSKAARDFVVGQIMASGEEYGGLRVERDTSNLRSFNASIQRMDGPNNWVVVEELGENSKAPLEARVK